MPARARRPSIKERPAATHPPDERLVLPNVVGGENGIPLECYAELCSGIVEPRKRRFLAYLAVLGNRTRAAKAAGVSTVLTWYWRRDDDTFAARYMDAMKIASELHEDEMFRRASEGTVEPVFQGGALVGGVRRFSDTLLIFGLKGAMPDKYSDRQKVEHSGQVSLTQKLNAARERALNRGKKK